MEKIKESVGTHVGRAFELLYPEEREQDERDTIEIAKKSGGDIRTMQLLEQYLTFLNETEEGYIEEAVPAALAGAAGKVAAGAGAVAPVVSAMYGAMYAIKAANFAWKNIMNKAHKACRGLDKESYTSCVRKYKLQGYQEQIKAMRKGLATCGKDKNPAKCKAKIQEKIKGIQLRISSLNQAIKRAKEVQMAKVKAAAQRGQ